MATKIAAKGAKIQIGDGTSPTEVFADIPSLRNVSGPNFTAESQDATTHDTSGNYRELVPTFLSGGEITFEMLWDPSNAVQEMLFTAFAARTLKNFKSIFPDTGAMTYAYAAYITNISHEASFDGILTANVTLAISGEVTRTP